MHIYVVLYLITEGRSSLIGLLERYKLSESIFALALLDRRTGVTFLGQL